LPLPPTSTLFPYTTLFRSLELLARLREGFLRTQKRRRARRVVQRAVARHDTRLRGGQPLAVPHRVGNHGADGLLPRELRARTTTDRKSTRLNSSHQIISYA